MKAIVILGCLLMRAVDSVSKFSEEFSVATVLNIERELLATFQNSAVVPVALAGSVRNDLLIVSDKNRTSIQTSDLKMNLMQRFIFALVTQMDEDVYMAYMGFEDGTFIGYSNQGQIVDQGLYGALHASSYATVSKNTTSYNLKSPDRFCGSTPNETTFCGSVFTAKAPIGEADQWHANLYDGYDVTSREWYKNAKENAYGFTTVYKFWSAGQGLTGYLELRDSNNIFVGAAAWDLRLADFSRRVRSYVHEIDPLDELRMSVAVLDGVLLNSSNRTVNSPPPYPPLTLLALSGDPSAARQGNVMKKDTARVAAINTTDPDIQHAARVLELNGWQSDRVFIDNHRFVYMVDMAIETTLEVPPAEPWWLLISYDIICPIGTFESELNEGCLPCPEDRTTSGVRSEVCDWCTVGYYLDERDDTCYECPSNTECNTPGITLQTLPLEEGYMRMHTLSDDVRYCVGSYSESDPGNTDICPGGGDKVNVPCDPDSNRVGPRCALCDHRYYLRSDECVKCKTSSLKSASVMIPLIIYSLLVLFLLYWLVRSTAAQAYNLKRGNKYARLQAKIRTKWKILFVAVQILVSMPDIVDAPYPPVFRNAIDFVGGILTLDLSIIVPFACLKLGDNEGRGASSYQRIVALSLLPFFLMVLIALYVFMRAKTDKRPTKKTIATTQEEGTESGTESISDEPNYKQAVVATSLLICFCLYPTVSSSVLSIFRKCEEWDSADGSGTSYYLRGDYRIKCRGKAYSVFRIYCGLFVIIWVIGVPLGYFIELYRYREQIDPLVDGEKARMWAPGGFDKVSRAMEMRISNPVIAHLGVLYGPYEPYYYWWEVIECIRRLLSTAITMLVLPGSYNQIFFALVIALGTLKLAGYFEPFFDDSDDILFEGLAWMVLFAQLIALNLRVHDNESSLSPMSIAFLVVVFTAISAGLFFIARDAHREKALYEMLKEDVRDAYRSHSSLISKVSSHSSYSGSALQKLSRANSKKQTKAENRQSQRDVATHSARSIKQEEEEEDYGSEESSQDVLHLSFVESSDVLPSTPSNRDDSEQKEQM